MLGVYDSRPLLAKCVCGTLVLFGVLGLGFAHAQLTPFYYPFYFDVTYRRKDTRVLSYFSVLQQKAGWGLGGG